MNISKRKGGILGFQGDVSIVRALEDAGVKVASQRCLNILGDQLIDSNLLNRDVSFLQAKVFSSPSQILSLGCLWSMADAATAHIILMFTKMYRGKSVAPATLQAYVEENQKTISLTEVVIAILGYDLPKGKMFSFATPLCDVNGTKYYLAFIEGEQFGKLLVSMPLTDILACHPDNFWVHAA